MPSLPGCLGHCPLSSPAPALVSLPQDKGGRALNPSFAALQAASQAAKAWPITSQLRAFADETVAKTGADLTAEVWAPEVAAGLVLGLS